MTPLAPTPTPAFVTIDGTTFRYDATAPEAPWQVCSDADERGGACWDDFPTLWAAIHESATSPTDAELLALLRLQPHRPLELLPAVFEVVTPGMHRIETAAQAFAATVADGRALEMLAAVVDLLTAVRARAAEPPPVLHLNPSHSLPYMPLGAAYDEARDDLALMDAAAEQALEAAQARALRRGFGELMGGDAPPQTDGHD